MLKMSTSILEIINDQKCYHCGLNCDDTIRIEDKYFCCSGCKTVYEILTGSGLQDYYSFDTSPGTRVNEIPSKFDYLEDEDTFRSLVEFADDRIALINFNIPRMHCSSCIWLLENLYKFSPAINESKVNFLRKTLSIKFFYHQLPLKELVKLLASIGYEPVITLETAEGKDKKGTLQNKGLYYRLGVAGFCFGNIMLLSFPEYLSIPRTDTTYRYLFLYLNLFLSLPVFFYSASGYFISAWKALRRKIINIDFPLSLGILVLFARSVYELMVLGEAGYFDSMAGLVFFLLLGKIFQSKTYETLNFERNYKSYFPLAVIKKESGNEKSVPVTEIRTGDRIMLRNNEIIPADSLLIKGDANIDYSFVTGESVPVRVREGAVLYAGGKQSGSAIEAEVVKEVSQSYLTQLWNNSAFDKPAESNFTIFSTTFSKYFTYAILLIAFAGFIIQAANGIQAGLNVFTAVLIVACPCALAMSVPFTFGNALRIMGRNKLYLKSIRTVENIAGIDTIVFDKTGTLTKTGDIEVKLMGEINSFHKGLIRSLVRNSTHPFSRKIYEHLADENLYDVKDFKETAGSGLEGEVLGHNIRMGSEKFITGQQADNTAGTVWFSIDNEIKGHFCFANVYRQGIKDLLFSLSKKYELFLLTGDNENERDNLMKLFPLKENIKFRMKPEEKLEFINELRVKGKKVMMVGDGLNDAGALSKSNTGIAVTENISTFTPASDGIIEAGSLKDLLNFLIYSDTCVKLIYISYAISLIYNIAGLSFAVQNLLTPIIAAILMPLSSISVVLFATAATNLAAGKRGLLSLS